MRDFFYEGIKRLDWGFGNPNITAGLIATLMMLVWILPRIHRWAYWPTLIACTTLGVFLIQTVSRGGVVAVAVGGLVLAGFAKRPWPTARWAALLICILGLIGYSIWLGTGSRYTKGIVEEDGAITNRWIIYRAVPQMIVDAPSGWGLKRGPEAFHNFYQPEGRTERYGSLVSSHLTWLMEFSWLQRMGYLFGWFAVLFLCLPSKKTSWYAVALATWVALGTVSMFTTMLNRWVIWVAPAVIFLMVVIARLTRRDWPTRRQWLIPLLTPILAVLIIICWGWFYPQSVTIQMSSGYVQLGDRGEALEAGKVWLVAPDTAIIGQAYGQKIRNFLKAADWESVSKETGIRCFLVEWQSGHCRSVKEDLVVVMGEGVQTIEGQKLKEMSTAREWVFLNPGSPTKELFESLGELPPVRVVWGEFHPGQNRMIWKALANKFDNVSFETAQAAGKYLPNWLDYVVSGPRSSDDTTSIVPQ